MKKLLRQSKVFLLLCAVLMVSAYLGIPDNRLNDHAKQTRFTFKTDGKRTITGYERDKPTGVLIIPAKLCNESITGIGEEAFFWCIGITGLTLPDSVTCIGKSAFTECTGIRSLTLPNSLTKIGYAAFYGCTGIKHLTLPKSLICIEAVAFAWCEGITELNRPDSLITIGGDYSWISIRGHADGAFWGCTGITKLTIPSSVTSIGTGAFLRCENLK